MIKFETELMAVISWDRSEAQRPFSLKFQTTLEELEIAKSFLEKVRLLKDDDFNKMFGLNRLDIQNKSIVALHVDPFKDFWVLYRGHNFFKTVECSFATYLSEEILGSQCVYQYSNQCGVQFYESLTTAQKEKLLQWSNKINVH